MTFQHPNPHLCDDPLWKDSDGNFWAMRDLSDGHLKNIQDMLNRMRRELIVHKRRAQAAVRNISPCWESSSNHLKQAIQSLTLELQCVDNWLIVVRREDTRRRNIVKIKKEAKARRAAKEARETAREISRKARETFPLCEYEWEWIHSDCVNRAYLTRLERVRETAEMFRNAWRGRSPTGRHLHLTIEELEAAAELFNSLDAPHVRSTHHKAHKTLRMFSKPQRGRFAGGSYIKELEEVYKNAKTLVRTLEDIDLGSLGISFHTRRALRILSENLGDTSGDVSPQRRERTSRLGTKYFNVPSDYLHKLEKVFEDAVMLRGVAGSKIYVDIQCPNDVHMALRELFGSLGVPSCKPTRRDHLEEIRKAATKLKEVFIDMEAGDSSTSHRWLGLLTSARQELFDLLS